MKTRSSDGADMKRIITVLALVLALAAPAWTSPLNDAKAAGTLGEQMDGYVGLVTNDASADVRALADEVNRKRRAHYAKIAKNRKADPAAVAAQAGKKLVSKAPAGQWVQTAKGDWKKVAK